MSVFIHFHENVRWRREQLLAEAEQERLLAQVPRRRLVIKPRLTRAFRLRLAQALYALAGWLSPEVAHPKPRFQLARAGRRNGIH